MTLELCVFGMLSPLKFSEWTKFCRFGNVTALTPPVNFEVLQCPNLQRSRARLCCRVVALSECQGRWIIQGAGLFVGNLSLLGNLSCCQVLPGASAANKLPRRENGT